MVHYFLSKFSSILGNPIKSEIGLKFDVPNLSFLGKFLQ